MLSSHRIPNQPGSYMQKRPLGNTGDLVSIVGFGGAAISGEGGGYGFGDISEQEALRLLSKSRELGVTLYDTAPVYGYGLSEERIGKAFKGCRDQVFIVSKCGVTWRENRRIYCDNSPSVVLSMFEESLKRLGSDYIDLYMVHWPDSRVDVRRTVDVLKALQDDGKIRHIGLSNFSAKDVVLAQEAASITVLQSEFSALVSQAETELFPLCRSAGLGFLGWGTLDKGILSGRLTNEREKARAFDRNDVRSWAPWWKKQDRAAKYHAVVGLKSYLDTVGCSLLSFALGYVLSYNELSSALCGVRSSSQLESLVEALEEIPDPQVQAEGVKIVNQYLFKAL